VSFLSSVSLDSYIQLLSLIVYVAAILWGWLAFFDIKHSHHTLSVKYVASAVTFLSMLTAGLFIAAQLPWILEQQWKVMSFAETLAWLVYDWTNGLAHLSVVLCVRAFMRWELSAPCQHGVCPSAALAREDAVHRQQLTVLGRDIAALQRRIGLLDREEDDGR